MISWLKRKDPLKEAELALKENNIERMEKAVSLLGRVDNPYVESRVNQLCGDLFRRNKKFKRAASFYSASNLARPDGNKAALYGLVECFRETRERDRFFEALDVYINHPDLPPIQIARCAVATAEFDDIGKTREICAKIESNSDLDVKSTIALARAFAMIEDKNMKEIFIQKSRELAQDNQKLLIEIASIDYHPSEYWELRYSGPQGHKAGVGTSYFEKERYEKRTERDFSFLRSVIEEHCRGPFSAIADCGCGSGRLTGRIHALSSKVEGFDISPTAIRQAREIHKGKEGLSFSEKDLSKENINNVRYDLIIDMNTVQCITDKNSAENIFKNYAQACQNLGYIVLIEANGSYVKPNIFHTSKFTEDDYENFLKHENFNIIHKSTTPWNDLLLVARKAEITI